MIKVLKRLRELDSGLVLAPERYDPRRDTLEPGVPLSEFVVSSRKSADLSVRSQERNVLLIDTSDADRGFLNPHKSLCLLSDLVSTKKIVPPGSIMISRLRPYLKQIAYVSKNSPSSDQQIVCSTEFYVLESRDGVSIAFLVPWLLSESVQSALAAGQEGGHHPRFHENFLLSLRVPHSILLNRIEISEAVEVLVNMHTESMSKLQEMTDELNLQLKKTKKQM